MTNNKNTHGLYSLLKAKSKKKTGFTLAEVMILLLTLSILLAAFAPVFTRRYSGGTVGDVWSYVPADTQSDAYFTDMNNDHRAQAYIGLTPRSQEDANTMSNSENGGEAKLIIGADVNVPRRATRRQNHIQFRYRNQGYGGLLANEKHNILVGGEYNSVDNSNAERNTSFGIGSLSSLTSGDDNTAVGYKALNSLTSGNYNTAMGSYSGQHITTGDGNTLLGYKAGINITDGDYNTMLGNQININGSRNTVVGNNIGHSNSDNANDNTFIGNNVAPNFKKGEGNTVIGYNTLSNLQSSQEYSYNTIIGADAGKGIKMFSGSGTKYKTCIGKGSCNDGYNELLNDDKERVFIGTHPVGQATGSSIISPIATLEVHNVAGYIDKSQPLAKVGNPTVLINGNLIVRGQLYREIPIYRQSTVSDENYLKDDSIDLDLIPKGLVLFKLFNSRKYSGSFFAGDDGMQRSGKSYETCRKKYDYDNEIFIKQNARHAFKDLRENCICTSNAVVTSYRHIYNSSSKTYPSQSYDWVSAYNRMSGGSKNNQGKTTNDADSYTNSTSKTNCQPQIIHKGNSPRRFSDTQHFGWYYDDRNNTTENINFSTWYVDKTRNKGYRKVLMQRNFGKSSDDYYMFGRDKRGVNGGINLKWNTEKTANFGTDYNYAHLYSVQSCCPNLTGYDEISLYPGDTKPETGLNSNCNEISSDARLKNIGDKFVAGLDEIKKINAYHYTFKADINKIPQVGVIAQDLKLIFPNAVTKDENGYYKIRWDEMFYAAINALKTLNSRINDLATKVDNYNKRVQQLKTDNKNLNEQLDVLSAQIAKLQNKK